MEKLTYGTYDSTKTESPFLDSSYTNPSNETDTRKQFGYPLIEAKAKINELIDCVNKLSIPQSVDQANRMPRPEGPKTMTYTQLISYLGEVANGDFTNVRLGDIVTFGNNSAYVAEFNRNYTMYGRGVPTIDFITCKHYDGYGVGTTMNDTDTTEGGFVGSKAYKTYLPAINTDLTKYFGSYLYTTKEYLANVISNGQASDGNWYDCKARMMCTAEVLGIGNSPLYDDWGWNINIANNHQQFALFKVKPETICTKENYWLRDVASAWHFSYVDSNGSANAILASAASLVVRVCFSIKCTS